MRAPLRRYFPDACAPSVFAIDYKKLRDEGYKGVIFDLDNTLVRHNAGSNEKADRLLGYISGLGLKIIILSNNDEERVRRFLGDKAIPFVCDADKPSPEGCRRALDILGLSPEEAVCAGDQIFVDIVCANAAGVPSILVHFIKTPGERWIGWKRYLEKLVLLAWRITGSPGKLGGAVKRR